MISEQFFQSEKEFVSWLRKRTTGRVRGVRLGIGDDAALARISSGAEMVATTDLLIEGVHFATSLHPPESVGHRSLAERCCRHGGGSKVCARRFGTFQACKSKMGGVSL